MYGEGSFFEQNRLLAICRCVIGRAEEAGEIFRTLWYSLMSPEMENRREATCDPMERSAATTANIARV